MVQASPVGLHMREDKVIVISKAVYIWATSLTSALGTSLLRWASELQCRPCAGEHVCAGPWEAMAHLSPAHSVSAVPQPLLCGSLLRGSPAHPQAGQAGHPCTAGTHRLTPASPSHASGASGFQGERTEAKPLWDDGAGDAIHCSGEITMLQWHSSFCGW